MEGQEDDDVVNLEIQMSSSDLKAESITKVKKDEQEEQDKLLKKIENKLRRLEELGDINAAKQM